MVAPRLFLGSMPLTAFISARSGCSSIILPRVDRLQVAHVAGVMPVELVLELVARRLDARGIDHDDVIAGINVGRELGLVLAPQPEGDGGSEAAERAVRGVYHVPVAPHLMGFGRKRTHLKTCRSLWSCSEPAPGVRQAG